MKRIMLILFLCLGIEGVWAGNVVSLSSVSGSPGDEVTVSLSLQNDDAVTALQLSLPLDDETHYVASSCILNGSRSNGHSVQATEKDGVLSILVFSLGNTALQGSSGELLSFRLALGNLPNTLTLSPTKLVLTDTDKTALTASSQSGSVTTLCARAAYHSMTIDYGRVPLQAAYHRSLTITNEGNQPLEVSGLTFSDAEHFSCSETFPLVVSASGNKTITIDYAPAVRGTVSETVTVVSNTTGRRNTIQLTATPYAVNELHVQPVNGISDETVTVSLTMNNMDAITGLQADIPLPSQLVYEEGSCQLSSRSQGHLLSSKLTDGVLHIVAVSTTGKAFTGNDGDIVSFRVLLNGRYNATVTPKNVHLTTYYEGVQQDMVSASTGATVGISSPRINVAGSLNMGRTPITTTGTSTLSVNNTGSAPLVISRATFSNEAVELVDELPITINPWKPRQLTLKNDRQDRGAFATTMQLYSNDPELRMATVNVSGERYAPNSLEATADNAYRSDRLNVHVGMQNIYDIRGVQFDLVLPTQVLELSTLPATKTERMGDLSVTCKKMDAQTVRVVAVSLSGHAIAAGEGEVMQLHFDVPSNMTAGNYTISLENVRLSTSQTDNAASNIGAEQASFQVLEPIPGDANGDGVVNIADVTAIINCINGSEPVSFVRVNADVNGDSTINIADVTGVINIINQ